MLTVLLATHNGSDTLGRTLDQFCALTPPPGGWKLLVVNNASTDGTEELVLSFRDRLPLEYLIEPRRGKNYALNTGLDHVSGDLVVFTDDDVLPDPDWLAAWRGAVDRNPEYAIFGGAIEPLYERQPPQWLAMSDGLEVLFSRTKPLPEGPIEPTGDNIYGPNFAIRTAALANGTRFDERFLVGPLGLIGDETDFVLRLAAQGNNCCFVPGARVRHIVHAAQFAWPWILKRFYRLGKSKYLFTERTTGRHGLEIFQVPRWLFRHFIRLAAIAPLACLTLDRGRILFQLRRIAFDLGMIVQSRSLHTDIKWRDPVLPRSIHEPTRAP